MGMSKEVRKIYENAQEKIQRMNAVLDEVIDDKVPVSTACAEYNINFLWFRRFVRYNMDLDSMPDDGRVRIKKEDWYCWQELFLNDLCGQDVVVPEKFEEVFEEITKKFLTERENAIVHRHYIDGATLEDLGKERGVTRERIRHIILKSLRKLRQPKARLPLCFGYDYLKAMENFHTAQVEYDRLYEAKQAEGRQIASEKISEVLRLTDEIQKKTEELRQTTATDVVLSDLDGKLNSVPLDDLNLSVRSYNCLKRYFAYHKMPANARSIAAMNGELHHVRNLGKKSVTEISRVMSERFGVVMVD